MERLFSDDNSLQMKWCLDWERKCCSAVVNFIYQSMKMKITRFPNEKLSYDILKTDFKKKGFTNIINVFNVLPPKKKSKHEFSIMEIW